MNNLTSHWIMTSGHDELLAALWRAADATRGRLGAIAEDSGITFQQYMVLQILSDSGEGGLPTLEIPRRMVELAPGITGLVDRLERLGLVRRQRSDADRRQIRCLLTAQGRELFVHVDAAAAAVNSEAIAMLTGHEVGVLRHLLGRVGRGNT